MISATENNTTGSVTATVWIGFAMMCIGMFMAILDVQVVATSLATIQEAPTKVLRVLQAPGRDLLYLLQNFANKLNA